MKEFPMSVRVRSEAVARLVRELDAGGYNSFGLL